MRRLRSRSGRNSADRSSVGIIRRLNQRGTNKMLLCRWYRARMSSEADLHGGVLEKDNVVTACQNVRINRPAGSVERKHRAHRAIMRRQSDDAADQTEPGTAPNGAARHVRPLRSESLFDPLVVMRIETVE